PPRDRLENGFRQGGGWEHDILVEVHTPKPRERHENGFRQVVWPEASTSSEAPHRLHKIMELLIKSFSSPRLKPFEAPFEARPRRAKSGRRTIVIWRVARWRESTLTALLAEIGETSDDLYRSLSGVMNGCFSRACSRFWAALICGQQCTKCIDSILAIQR